jgi:hypothetical protein
MIRVIPSCQEVSELVSQAQDRPLTLAEKFGLYVHLPLCHGCRNFSRQVAFLRAAVKRYLKGDNAD